MMYNLIQFIKKNKEGIIETLQMWGILITVLFLTYLLNEITSRNL